MCENTFPKLESLGAHFLSLQYFMSNNENVKKKEKLRKLDGTTKTNSWGTLVYWLDRASVAVHGSESELNFNAEDSRPVFNAL